MRIDKAKLLKLLRLDVEKALAVMTQAAKAAHDAATHPENKPENDKDTRGLEASYLAGAQSKRAAELAKTLQALNGLVPRAFKATDTVAATALVRIEVDETESVVFICPFGAGLKASLGGVDIQVITPQSPLGDAVLGRKVGDAFEVQVAGRVREVRIVSVD